MSTIKTNRIEPVGSTAGTVTVDGTMVFTQGATFPGGISVGQAAYFSGGITVAGGISAGGTVVMGSPFMFRNRVINGSMIVNQRGTTTNPNINGFGPTTGPVSIAVGDFTLNRTYDRWNFQRSPGITYSFSGGLTSSPPPGFTRYCRIRSGATASVLPASSGASLYQVMEASTLMDFDYGKSTARTSTVSFWVRSNQTGTFEGTVSAYPSGTRAYLFPYTVNSADTWEYKTVSITGDTTSTGWTYDIAPTTLVDNTASRGFAYLSFTIAAGSSASGGVRNTWQTRSGAYNGYSAYTDGTGVQIAGFSGGYLDITGVQWELGNVATPFEHRPYETELALCQRYFQRNIYQNFAGYGAAGAGVVQTLTLLRPMRAIPTMTTYNPAAFSFSNCTASSGTGVHGEAYSNHNYIMHVTVTTTGSFQFNNSMAAGFDYSAEL